MSDGVIGREHELAAGDHLLGALRDGAGALVLHGEAGIGKSSIWSVVVDRARDRDLAVLACRPAEAERTLALSGLADLLERVAGRVLPTLPRPQRRALEVALLRVEPDDFVADWRVVATAFRSVLVQLADEAPVLVAIDDVQWLDRPTRRVLEFGLRRVAALPIGVLVTARTPAYDATPLSLDRALAAGQLTSLDLGPLSLGALYQLLRVRLGFSFSRPTLLRIEEASGGNPFYALEVARELARTGAHPVPGQPLPLPRRLSDLAASRIRRLPARAREALLVAATASHPTVELVVAASARPDDETAAALAQAEDAGIIAITNRRIAFTHPLLASAVHSEASSEAKRGTHRRLAAAARDPEQRARHLALSTTRRSSRVAASLSSAAQRLARRGAPEEAAALCELAAELTPLRDVRGAIERRLAAAELHAATGGFDRAQAIVDELSSEVPAGKTRAEVLLQRAAICRTDFVAMTTFCEQALAECESDLGLGARIHQRLATAWHVRGDPEQALRHARAGLSLAERTDDERLTLTLVASAGVAETWAGSVTPDLLEDGAARETELKEPLPFEQSPRAALGIRFFYSGRMAEARRLLQEVYERATDAGDEVSRVSALVQIGPFEFFAGNWRAAGEYEDKGLELETQLGIERGVLTSYRALLAACLGDLEEARSLAERATDRARAVGENHVELLSTGVVGFAELSRGNIQEAARIYGHVLERDCATTQPKTSRYFDDGIEALVAAGEIERARSYARLYERDSTRTPMSVVPAKAARSMALINVADGDLESAVAALERSLALHDIANQPFERARTLLSLGVAQRRLKQRRAARTRFEAALEIFERLPAPLWAARVRAELRRVGLRRGSASELTETEQRVAELAAAGLTNKEVAAQAFLAPKSVEDVMARIYRKLGIHSRAELGALMRERPRA
jgi:DNA-binding CsgD family transcriptional regulator